MQETPSSVSRLYIDPQSCECSALPGIPIPSATVHYSPPAALSVSVWPTPTTHQHPSIHPLKTLVGDISPQLMLQPLPLNPLMAPNGGLWFNRYEQFQFSIPLNYGRLEQHAATACERHRETAGRQAGREFSVSSGCIHWREQQSQHNLYLMVITRSHICSADIVARLLPVRPKKRHPVLRMGSCSPSSSSPLWFSGPATVLFNECRRNRVTRACN